MRALAIMIPALLIAGCSGTAPTYPVPSAAQMYPVPPGAYDVRYYASMVMDTFLLKAPFPDTSAVAHYERIFDGWTPCKAPAGWQGAEVKGSDAYHHTLQRGWTSPDRNRSVHLVLIYASEGVRSRRRPESDELWGYLMVTDKPETLTGSVDCSAAG